jgi:hypothetical protein
LCGVTRRHSLAAVHLLEVKAALEAAGIEFTGSRLAADKPLISRSTSKSASMRLTASTAIGEIGVAACRGRQGDRLHAHALAVLHPLPRRRPHPHHKQRGRTRLALGTKSWLFAGSERRAERAALMYTLIGTAKRNDVDPQAWLADVLARIADYPVHCLEELLPSNWALDWERRNLAA